MREIRKAGATTLREIADALNARGVWRWRGGAGAGAQMTMQRTGAGINAFTDSYSDRKPEGEGCSLRGL
jgi:hypothetical protein